MTRYIRSLLILFLILGTCACTPEAENNSSHGALPSVATETRKAGHFGFYKSFAFCDSNVGYFSQTEADALYAGKTVSLENNEAKEVDLSSLYSKEEWACIEKNLGVHPTRAKEVKYKEPFPFDQLVLINDTYLVVVRDGYFFAFAEHEKATTSPSVQHTTTGSVFASLFNTPLVGLSVLDENQETIFKKYGTDSISECMCNSPSLYIDDRKKELNLFNYCDGAKSLQNMDKKYVLKITSIMIEGEKLVIHTDSNARLTFKQAGNPDLFELIWQGQIPTEHIGNELKNYFTPYPAKFSKTTCGNYDG